MIDINVGCGNWPFRPTKYNDAAKLEEWLRSKGIARACAYPLEAIFWPDPQEANELRLPELMRSPFFIPSAVINPTLANYMENYRLCRGEWGVPMIRLFPSYHAYNFENADFLALAERMAADGVVMGIYSRVEDQRQRHPLLGELQDIPLEAIAGVARRLPQLPVIALGALLGRETKVAPANLYLETSHCDGDDPLEKALQSFGAGQLLFGTHAPMFYPLPNILKIQRAGVPAEVRAAVLAENARRLLQVA